MHSLSCFPGISGVPAARGALALALYRIDGDPGFMGVDVGCLVDATNLDALLAFLLTSTSGCAKRPSTIQGCFEIAATFLRAAFCNLLQALLAASCCPWGVFPPLLQVKVDALSGKLCFCS
jgi:hypothetical protein